MIWPLPATYWSLSPLDSLAAGKEALRELVRAQKAPLQRERRTHISQDHESGSLL